MKIKSQSFLLNNGKGKPVSSVFCQPLLPNEVAGVTTDLISIEGPCSLHTDRNQNIYHVLLSLSGRATLKIQDGEWEMDGKWILRPFHYSSYAIEVQAGNVFACLAIRKHLNDRDLSVINKVEENHTKTYAKRFLDCPVYTEDIKSDKCVNRMLLPEGSVPRFCMGSVETIGPDRVDSHKHPMLDQIFLGMDNCRGTCMANGKRAALAGNTLLHIPLGSTHSVSVEKENKLSYIWMDFFLTHEGEAYMSEQHTLKEEALIPE